jgi:hypothetical protein
MASNRMLVKQVVHLAIEKRCLAGFSQNRAKNLRSESFLKAILV